jgi:hypothetical protein
MTPRLRLTSGPLGLLLAVLLIAPYSGRAQSTGRYRNYRYDSTFHIGSHALTLVRLAKDTIGFDFNYSYMADLVGIRTLLNTPDSLLSPGQQHEKHYYLDADTRSFGLIFTPSRFKAIESESSDESQGGSFRCHDNYVGGDENLQLLGYSDTPPSNGTWVSAIYGQVSALEIPKLAAPVSQTILTMPRYVSTLGLHLPSTKFYDSTFMGGHQLVPDSLRFQFKFGFHIAAPDIDIDAVNPADTIAVVKFFQRVDTLQGTGSSDCRCRIYEPFETLVVTRAIYSNGDISPPVGDVEGNYRDVSKWIDIRGGRYHPVPGQSLRSRLGSWLGGLNAGPCTTVGPQRNCASLLLWLRDTLHVIDSGSVSLSNDAYESDLIFSFTTTRRTKIRYLRSRVSSHPFEALRTGELDDWLKEEIDLFYTDSVLAPVRRQLLRFGVYDEPHWPMYPANRLLGLKLQDFIEDDSAGDKRGLFQNPTTSFDSYRTFLGDLNPTQRKVVHQMSRQLFNVIAGPVPARYANPDFMDDAALGSFYRPSDSAGFPKMIALNTPSDYASYLYRTQKYALGKYFDHDNNDLNDSAQTTVRGALVPMLGRLVDVGRFKYQDLVRDSVPIWNVIQTSGWLPEAGNYLDAAGYRGLWSQRLVTPEEVAVQSWLSLNAGVQGLEFQEPIFDGPNVGYVDQFLGTGRINWSLSYTSPGNGEYDTATASHSKFWLPTPKTQWRLPKMWLGFRTRYLAVKRIIAELRKIDGIYSKLYYRKEQISLFDSRQSLDTFPLVQSLQTRLARRFPNSSGGFADSTAVDVHDSTYLELTHLYPTPGDSAAFRRGARYMVLTNRRTWPIDTLTYTSRTTQYGSATRGYGNIDVRRPVVILKNTTGVIADSFYIEKVGYETTTRDTARFGDTVVLGWLEPGWGALYRVTPLPSGVSQGGTAYNNAVHSINPSTPDSVFDRLVVYEKDSIVYLRAVDSTGRWSRAWRISDSLDVRDTSSPWLPRARNYHPAVAVTPGGTSALVVWERWHVDSAAASVEALWIEGRPKASAANIGDSIRFHVTRDRLRTNPLDTLGFAPAAIGIDGGYVIAYATGNEHGMSITALQDQPYGLVSGTTNDTASAHNICWNCQGVALPPLIDSTSYFPTLAYVRNFGLVPFVNHWRWCGSGPGDSIVPSTMTAHVVHLAYQQGRLHLANAQYIMYNQAAITFRQNQFPAYPPAIWIAPTEHVSAGLPGCGFLHPSIAADSVLTGVAFQAHSNARRRVVLRFRDTLSQPVFKATWKTPTYGWAERSVDWFEWPSVTQFPGLPRTALRGATGGPKGGVVWYHSNDTTGVTPQYFYRFGYAAVERIPNGQYPTLTLVPLLDTLPFESSSVLYRGDTSTRYLGPRPGLTTGTYYPAALLNTGPARSSLFRTAVDDNIVHGVDIRTISERNCSPIVIRDRDIKANLMTTPIVAESGEVVTSETTPGLPPLFFAEPVNDNTVVETLEQAERVARTSVFAATTTNQFVRRHVSRADNVMSWLDGEPYDSALQRAADVWVLTELVRAADSVVLWHDDTISVRAMTVDSLDESVEVPTSIYAAPSTPVFVRLRVEATAGLAYDLSGGFEWSRTGPPFTPKLVRPTEHGQKALDAWRELSVVAQPNPVSAELQVSVLSRFSGRLTCVLRDNNGEVVGTAVTIAVSANRPAILPYDVRNVPTGSYYLEVTVNGIRAVTKVAVLH